MSQLCFQKPSTRSTFKISLPPERISLADVSFVINELPGTTIRRGKRASEFVLPEPFSQIRGVPDVKAFITYRAQHVHIVHTVMIALPWRVSEAFYAPISR